jgi:ribosomal protein S21
MVLHGGAAMMMSATKVCNVKLVVKEGEAIDTVIMRFRREVNKSGHLRTLRNRRYFEDARARRILIPARECCAFDRVTPSHSRRSPRCGFATIYH